MYFQSIFSTRVLCGSVPFVISLFIAQIFVGIILHNKAFQINSESDCCLHFFILRSHVHFDIDCCFLQQFPSRLGNQHDHGLIQYLDCQWVHMLEVRIQAHSNQRNALNQRHLIRNVTYRNVCWQLHFRQPLDRWIHHHPSHWPHLLPCPRLFWGNLRVFAQNTRNERIKKLQCQIFIDIETWCCRLPGN